MQAQSGIGNAYLHPQLLGGASWAPGAWISAPKIAVVAGLAFAAWQMRRPKLPSRAKCQEKYCHQTHVDKPMNTLLKDQSEGAGLTLPPKSLSLQTPYEATKRDYLREAVMSPGVRLVAHAVA